MSLRGLALCIPPKFAAYMVGQLIAHICNQRFGTPIIGYDEAQADPQKRALLERWVHGAGEVDAITGQSRTAPHAAAEPRGTPPAGGPSAGAPPGQTQQAPVTPPDACDHGSSPVVTKPTTDEFRRGRSGFGGNGMGGNCVPREGAVQ